ncbi:hypothetical protein C1X75_04400 [Pseudomonas sp. FW305-17]|nr:hypothetical protein C1X79_17355 [Pseudomonas sp. FW305-42]PNA19905.1 hypothetical protein C1X78_23830 [Pseudomonas sp. MPR-R1B]PNB28306.1 hypothetical protein C1X80_04110 [Pseudomonas sp. DP16D-E2]PNB44658.1 hypothetical protein C1X75_04400 [Pseudomonas sp. FW305-17]PNB64275.1 hypothetical protein C1X77_03450 [Pseudomonas sp. GW531-E2]PNB68893.1 hypothetical protein C1X76_07505 [Pseudomonas sp. FW305-127]
MQATLRRYEALHRTKGTAEGLAKAEVNAELASRIERTIAKALCEVEERTQTGRDRFVLLNQRAWRAAVRQGVRRAAKAREEISGQNALRVSPSKGSENVKQTSDVHKQRVPVLNEPGIRRRPHTTVVTPMRQYA